MKNSAIVIIIAVSLAFSLFAQSADTTQVLKPQPPTKQKKAVANPVYYGGTVGFSFGDYFRVNVSPMVGYKLSPKASVGVKVGYEYIKDKRYDPALTSSNYGGSVFGRYRLIPQAYAHAEFAYFSYKYKISDLESDRTWVPFLLLGGGYVQRIAPNVSFVAEVLVDVLQDSKSPYKNWDPFISIGVAAGF